MKILILFIFILSYKTFSNEDSNFIGIFFNYNENSTNSILTNNNNPNLVDFDSKVTESDVKNNFGIIYDYNLFNENQGFLKNIIFGFSLSYFEFNNYYKKNENLRYFYNNNNDSIYQLNESNNVILNFRIIELSPRIQYKIFTAKYIGLNLILMPKIIFPISYEAKRYAEIENEGINYSNEKQIYELNSNELNYKKISFGSEINLNFRLFISNILNIKQNFIIEFGVGYNSNFTSILTKDDLFYENSLLKTSFYYSF